MHTTSLMSPIPYAYHISYVADYLRSSGYMLPRIIPADSRAYLTETLIAARKFIPSIAQFSCVGSEQRRSGALIKSCYGKVPGHSYPQTDGAGGRTGGLPRLPERSAASQ
jgi:hypothetical protein